MDLVKHKRPPSRLTHPPELRVLGPVAIPGVGERLIRVCIPHGAHRAGARPPLLFMWDGQNIFDDAPSFAGGWHLHTAVARRAQRRRTAPVIVGLDHGGARRLGELNPFMPKGQGCFEPLLAHLCDTLIPQLSRELNLAEGPGQRVVGGSSLGGLASLAAHLGRPDVFGGAWAMSPSLFAGRWGIFRSVSARPKPWRTRIYLDAGGREAGGHLVHAGQRLKAHLHAHGWQGDEVLWHVTKSGAHNERHWRRRSPRALRFFYG